MLTFTVPEQDKIYCRQVFSNLGGEILSETTDSVVLKFNDGTIEEQSWIEFNMKIKKLIANSIRNNKISFSIEERR